MSRPSRPAAKSARPRRHESVDDFMAALDHPLKPALELVCSTIRGAGPKIAEGIKWNAPSFCLRGTQQYFATVNIHGSAKGQECVLVILHQDAKVKASKAALQDITRQWIAKLG